MAEMPTITIKTKRPHSLFVIAMWVALVSVGATSVHQDLTIQKQRIQLAGAVKDSTDLAICSVELNKARREAAQPPNKKPTIPLATPEYRHEPATQWIGLRDLFFI